MGPKLQAKLDNVFDRAFLPLIIVLVGTLAFGLGRLSKLQEAKADLVVEQMPKTEQASPNSAPAVSGATLGKQNSKAKAPDGGASDAKDIYVASKNGTKYYLLNCSGVSRIKEENKIYFATKAEAEARGLTPAANCPGL